MKGTEIWEVNVVGTAAQGVGVAKEPFVLFLRWPGCVASLLNRLQSQGLATLRAQYYC